MAAEWLKSRSQHTVCASADNKQQTVTSNQASFSKTCIFLSRSSLSAWVLAPSLRRWLCETVPILVEGNSTSFGLHRHLDFPLHFIPHPNVLLEKKRGGSEITLTSRCAPCLTAWRDAQRIKRKLHHSLFSPTAAGRQICGSWTFETQFYSSRDTHTLFGKPFLFWGKVLPRGLPTLLSSNGGFFYLFFFFFAGEMYAKA